MKNTKNTKIIITKKQYSELKEEDKIKCLLNDIKLIKNEEDTLIIEKFLGHLDYKFSSKPLLIWIRSKAYKSDNKSHFEFIKKHLKKKSLFHFKFPIILEVSKIHKISNNQIKNYINSDTWLEHLILAADNFEYSHKDIYYFFKRRDLLNFISDEFDVCNPDALIQFQHKLLNNVEHKKLNKDFMSKLKQQIFNNWVKNKNKQRIDMPQFALSKEQIGELALHTFYFWDKKELTKGSILDYVSTYNLNMPKATIKFRMANIYKIYLHSWYILFQKLEIFNLDYKFFWHINQPEIKFIYKDYIRAFKLIKEGFYSPAVEITNKLFSYISKNYGIKFKNSDNEIKSELEQILHFINLIYPKDKEIEELEFLKSFSEYILGKSNLNSRNKIIHYNYENYQEDLGFYAFTLMILNYHILIIVCKWIKQQNNKHQQK